MVPQKGSNLGPMKGFDIESDPQDVLFNMGNFDVAIIEKSILVIQDVLTQMRSNLPTLPKIPPTPIKGNKRASETNIITCSIIFFYLNAICQCQNKNIL